MISVKMIVKLKVYDQRNSFISHQKRKLYDTGLKIYDPRFDKYLGAFFV